MRKEQGVPFSSGGDARLGVRLPARPIDALSRGGAVGSVSAVLLIAALAGPVAGQVTERVSVDSGWTQGNADSEEPSVSADGRYVAFRSTAGNLVVGDTNGVADVFVRDRQSGTTELVSVDSNEAQGNDLSDEPCISADGRYVAFTSWATNLVGGDTNGSHDVFVRDRQGGTTERVSVDASAAQGNGPSSSPSISADGRYVAFKSWATNLVNGDANGTFEDVFVRDRQGGTTERVNISSNGAQANDACEASSISADGRYVGFYTLADNLVSGDTNGSYDAFVHDRQVSTTVRVSINSGGVQGNGDSVDPSISADGRYVAFTSTAGNLVTGDTNGFADIFMRDCQSATTERVSVDSNGAQGNDHSFAPAVSVSADGRCVVFLSSAANLVSGDTGGFDVFIRDRQNGTTELVSIDSSGAQANGDSYDAAVSADGCYVAFESLATNLVSGDTNVASDVFVRVFDVSPPILSCPSQVYAIDHKGSPPGEVVFFLVTATDDQDPAPSVVCVPFSGSFFPPGVTMVTCTATDTSGNQSDCMFPVVVMPPIRRSTR